MHKAPRTQETLKKCKLSWGKVQCCDGGARLLVLNSGSATQLLSDLGE